MSIQFTRDFNSDEFICKCGCGHVNMSLSYMMKIQRVRTDYGKKMIVTPKGGFRCPEANLKAGGALKSLHLFGRAGDYEVFYSADRGELLYLAMKHGLWGIGIGSNFLHLDDRGKPDKRTWHYY